MDQRERFEAWHTRQYISTDPLEWDGDGYADFDHNRAWKAWQAAEAAALELAAQACEKRIGHDFSATEYAEAIRKLAAPVERGGDKS